MFSLVSSKFLAMRNITLYSVNLYLFLRFFLKFKSESFDTSLIKYLVAKPFKWSYPVISRVVVRAYQWVSYFLCWFYFLTASACNAVLYIATYVVAVVTYLTCFSPILSNIVYIWYWQTWSWLHYSL